MDRLDNL